MNRYWATTSVPISRSLFSVCARVLCCFGLLAAASLYAPAQSGGLVDISGRVIDKTTGAAITAGWVIAVRSFDRSEKADRTREPFQAKSRIGGDGTFRLHRVPPGKYWVRGVSPGFTDHPDRHGLRLASQVTVRAGELRDSVVVELVRTAAISGTVLDELGLPIRNAIVNYLAVASDETSPLRNVVWNADLYTDDRGQFRIGGLSPGRYVVQVDRTNAIPDFASAPDHSSNEGPVPGIEPLRTVFFPGAVRLSEASPIALEPGAEISGLEIRFPKERTFSISGTVIQEGGEPLESYDASAELIQSPHRVGSASAPAKTTKDGRFRISGLTAGNYVIRGRGSVSGSNRIRTGFAYVAITSGDVEQVQLVVKLPGRAVGSARVRVDEGGRVATKLIDEVWKRDEWDLSLVPDWKQPGSLGLAIPKPDKPPSRPGEVEFYPLYAGSYRLTAHFRDVHAYVAAGTIDGRDATRQAILLDTHDATYRLEVIVRTDGARIVGMLNSKATDIISKPVLLLLPEDDRKGETMYRKVAAFSEGRFEFWGIAPGDYRMVVLEMEDAAKADWEPSEEVWQNAKRLRLSSGETVNLDLDWEP